MSEQFKLLTWGIFRIWDNNNEKSKDETVRDKLLFRTKDAIDYLLYLLLFSYF